MKKLSDIMMRLSILSMILLGIAGTMMLLISGLEMVGTAVFSLEDTDKFLGLLLVGLSITIILFIMTGLVCAIADKVEKKKEESV